jgi:hypothetical protein
LKPERTKIKRIVLGRLMMLDLEEFAVLSKQLNEFDIPKSKKEL